MKAATLWLPVFKQGDDLGHHLKDNSVEDAFMAMAEQYTAAASMCKKMASIASEHKLEVYADTHFIEVSGPVEVIDNLTKDGILSVDDYEGCDCDDCNGDCGDDCECHEE